MKRLHLLALLTLFLAGCAAAATAGPLTAQSSVDDTLDALDARGQGLQSFTADVRLADTDAATGDSQTHVGKVWFQSGDPARIRVTFETRLSNGKIIPDKIEYLLSGGDLVDRNYQTKVQTTRKILKTGEKMNLLKLGEGPFPLPIGQKKEDVHANFDVAKVDAKKDDPADTVHLQFKPKADTRFANQFKTIDVWAQMSDGMPKRIETMDKNETALRTTDLNNVTVNPKLADGDFALPKVSERDWQLRDEAFNQ